MSGRDRFGYFVRKVSDFREIWGLFDNGWAMGEDDEGRKAVLFWPEEAFAEKSAVGKYENHKPRKIELDYFVEKWIPGLTKDNYQIAVFPTTGGKAVFVSPDFLLQSIAEESEGLELPSD